MRLLSGSVFQSLPRLLHVHAGKPQQVLAQNLAFGLFGNLWVAFHEIVQYLAVPEGVERPPGVPDREEHLLAGGDPDTVEDFLKIQDPELVAERMRARLRCGILCARSRPT
jgi:hypothetical protein